MDRTQSQNVFICPKCGSSQIYVVDTRIRNNTVYRRRRCMVCGYRYNTVEILYETYEELSNMNKFLLHILKLSGGVIKDISDEIVNPIKERRF